ncbi:sugar ABC transporter ATP-binding protein [Dactylosporangium maewongense]|uniref:Sugar ABC transporter ATP-binding protein n=1 Tax=Dactylosporangium maewongense TaxID=634393 RepID=A0ABN2CZF6_9ACTN
MNHVRTTPGVPVLSLREISKSYTGVPALSGVNLDVHAGEAIGLMGQNGAGKSTLVKIVSGAQGPSAGTIAMGGRAVRFQRPADAQAAGIHTIYQELSVVPQLTAAENIFLSDLPRRGGAVNWAKLRREARDALGSLGFDIDVEMRVRDLTLAERQAVEIAKVVHHKAKVVLLDEPTATLPTPDVDKLLTILRGLKADGVSILYISHRLDEVYDICDRVTVLRDGRQITTASTQELTADEAVRQMIGDKLLGGMVGQVGGGAHRRLNPNAVAGNQPPALEVRSVSDESILRDISLTVMPGEAVAVTGLLGSGQSELAACIFGSRSRTAGDVYVNGRKLSSRSPRATIRAGLGWLPEERKVQGLVLGMSVAQNLTVTDLNQVSKLGFLRRRVEQRLAKKLSSTLAIKTRGVDQPVGTLSGGNQQKVVFGKWLLAGSRVLILSEPTRGIDVAAKEEIYREMRNFLAEGGSILVSSSEIDEALMCDRIYVLGRGRVVGEFSHDDIEHDRLVSLLR